MSKPIALICDLDGTLAIMNGRSPFEYKRCVEDSLNEKVATFIKMFQFEHGILGENRKVIFVSGREDIAREETISWLSQHGITFDELFMRKAGDHRKDMIVKGEIYDEQIKDNYEIYIVLDDRDQVVRMWRDLGLTYFQVNYGDF